MSNLRPLAIGIVALAALSFTGCTDEREVGYKDVEISEYQRQIKELEDQLFNKDRTETIGKLPSGGATVGELQAAAGNNTIVTTEPVGIHFSIESSVLFKSGSATLNAQAKSSLNKVITIINEKFPNYDIQVVGFTDDEKITRAKNTWNDNWDLSTGRAREVLLYLEGRGIPAKRLGLAGYGQERPLVPNTNAENRQKNRRVEIVAIPPAK